MQQTGKATPRPWYEADDLEVVTRQGFTIASILHDDGFVTNEQASADRALIVRAVNAHDELVEALRDIVSFLDEYGREGYCLVCCPPEPGEHIEGDCELLTARSVLAKAEGA